MVAVVHTVGNFVCYPRIELHPKCIKGEQHARWRIRRFTTTWNLYCIYTVPIGRIYSGCTLKEVGFREI